MMASVSDLTKGQQTILVDRLMAGILHDYFHKHIYIHTMLPDVLFNVMQGFYHPQ